ncbi:MAG: flagellar biosynthesis anti-sigma factor FlgM [Deltaproteobacteria bacterium]|jgi:flagellar biosynthesis anti-sigma factor FlgM|nr:flagellar biosynthesis anti-sigma factor FlgM [Deltaproteobacteria bacterium]
MKIDTNSQPLKIKKPEFQSPAEKSPGAEAAAETQVATGDKVNISERSRLIAKARELASLAPDVRAEKVADLTARIASGTYKVSSGEVADSIIRKSFDGIF